MSQHVFFVTKQRQRNADLSIKKNTACQRAKGKPVPPPQIQYDLRKPSDFVHLVW